ncbi:PLD nuclease N-terminal domain-containing protein [Hugenholtzia roseola]|uniref:PLD nuclease N-terminal domain-containing protein n=1 Tax=Hugenholtzia roseola TaxID=1002 RepID=UPI0003FF34B2|nr:PLD nuclease N-terminal domain-containing protein [Hugenholtzia roseola]
MLYADLFLNLLGTLNGATSGIFSLLWAALAIYALYTLWTSAADSTAKVLWSLGIFFFPFIGAILYFVLGRK